MIKNDYDYWNNIWGLFECDYPQLAEQAIGWHPSGRHEIVIQYPGGRRDVYNSFLPNDMKHRIVHNPNNPIDYNKISEEEWMIEFGKCLKKKMLVSGIDQEQLSRLSGISRVSINRYLNGKSIPNARNLQMLASALRCSINEFRIDIYDELER